MECTIAKLTRYPVKGEPGLPVAEMKLVSGHGIEGDPHKGGGRQVSLLSAGARRWIEAQTVSGLCFKRFRENVLVDGLPDSLERGVLLSAGGAVLRITDCKECFNECYLRMNGIPCRLSSSAVFAEVLQDGAVAVGDNVEITPDL